MCFYNYLYYAHINIPFTFSEINISKLQNKRMK